MDCNFTKASKAWIMQNLYKLKKYIYLLKSWKIKDEEICF